MNIHPRPDQELAIQEAIRAGLISSEIDALDIGLENLRKRLVELFIKEDKPLQTNLELAPNRSKTQDPNRTPQQAAEHIRTSRKGNTLPKGISIRDLINEGRA